MCMYNHNFNDKFDLTNLSEDEYKLLKKIYDSIEVNDMDNARHLTENLIALQSSDESIKILNEAISFL